MSETRIKTTASMVIIWLCVLFLPFFLSAAEKVTGNGMRSTFGSYAVAAPVVSTSPKIDGDITESAWDTADGVPLVFIDERSPGTPRSATKVRITSDADNLYVAFYCRELNYRFGKETLNKDDQGILKGHYTGVILDTGRKKGNRYFLLASTGRGTAFTAARTSDADAWDSSWDPEGFEVKCEHYVEHWSAEYKIPLSGSLKDLPKLIGINFVRNRFITNKKKQPKPDMSYYNFLHAFRPFFPVQGDRKEKELLPAVQNLDPKIFARAKRPLFAKLFLPAGKKDPKEMAKLIKASAEAGPQEKETEPELLPGFIVSAKKIVKIYGGRAMMVPMVTSPPVIDGDPGDKAWKAVNGIVLGYLLSDVKGIEKANPTHVKIISDKKNMYVLAICKEEEVEKLKTDEKRALWTNDVMEILFDAGHFSNYSSYYHILVNPKGRIEMIRDRADLRWKPKSLKVKCKISPGSWTVEMKIAFKDFGVDPENLPKLWGANFSRTRWVNRPAWNNPAEPNWDQAWVANSHTVLHVPDRWGHLFFQAGNAYPKKLAASMKRPGLKIFKPPVVTPAAIKKITRKAKFAKKPRVSVANGKATITFEVKYPIDVTVMILDEEGNIVRHLASGVLGKNSPEPFQPDKLEQTLTWDFKDDSGTSLTDGNYSVKVGLGLEAEYDRALLWTPYEFRGIRGIAAGPDGTLYVIDAGFDKICAYDRDGKYKRQVYPMPANLSAEKVAGARPIRFPDGSWMPTNYHGMYHALLPGTVSLHLQSPIVKGKKLIFVNNGSRSLRTPKRLMTIGTDGSVPPNIQGPIIAQEHVPGRSSVAVSPDGKYTYVTGLRGRDLWPPRGGEPHQVVFRFSWDDPRPPYSQHFAKPFIGALFVRGKGKNRLNDPRCVAVDKAGTIYVADFGNNRIALFKPDGSYDSEIPVECPDAVRVHPKTGDIYVLTAGRKGGMLKKFKTGEKKPAAETRMPGSHIGVLALDYSARPARLWVARGNTLVQFLDEKTGFKSNGDPVTSRRDPKLGSSPRPYIRFDFEHDPKRKHIYVRNTGVLNPGYAIFDTETDTYIKTIGTGDQKKDPKTFRPYKFDFLHMGPDDHFYTINKLSAKGGIRRYTPDWKPAVFSDIKSPIINARIFNVGNGDYSTFWVSHQGDIYLLTTAEGVSVFGTGGKLKYKNLVAGKLGFMWHIVRADSKGGIYLGMTVRDSDELYHRELKGLVPTGFDFNAEPRYHYQHFTGSVVKFKHTGGKVTIDPKGKHLIALNLAGLMNCRIEGMEWTHYGFCPRLYRDTENCNCNCEQASFDIDRFDRLFIPNAMMFRVQVVDRNNNPILKVGRYGNMDASGKGSADPKGIGFAWPMSVSVDDEYLYVGDTWNYRTVRAKLGYMSEKSVKIKK